MASPEWHERYDRRIEDYRLPRGREVRESYAETVGADAQRLLEALTTPSAPGALAQLPAGQLLRRVWRAEFTVVEGWLRLRDPKELPAAADQVESLYEPEARYGTKRGLRWVGYKVHLTETCDDAMPDLMTHVETTVAPASDIHQLATIHEGLAHNALLPAQHLVDAGYARARNQVEARERYRVEVIRPIPADHQWQAKAQTDFDVSRFTVNWDARVATCPQGRTSVRWSETPTARGLTITRVEFAANDCTVCPARHSARGPGRRFAASCSTCARSTKQSRQHGNASRWRTTPQLMPSERRSRAHSPRACAPSASAGRAIVASPRPTCSTSLRQPP